ncbi:Autophagy protein 5 [Aphelenchoides bicaudatus]|nr:Autophagy protein 5 [Aphelenchoides bicaudatus]
MEDYEIFRKIWEAGVPIEFRLDKEEHISKSVTSYFEILPRIGYFYLELDNVLKFFSNACNSPIDSTNVWLEVNGTALKWHYPIGVLFDLHSNEQHLPWTITVHLKNFPDSLLRFSTREEKRSCFFQAIKEADQLKHKGNVVSDMKPEEHNRLFDSLCNHKFDDFRSASNRLRVIDKAAYLPIRFYKSSRKSFHQILIKATNEDAALLSINDAVKLAFPDENIESAKILTHGILLPPETPLNWLSRNLAYADNVLHIVVKDN